MRNMNSKIISIALISSTCRAKMMLPILCPIPKKFAAKNPPGHYTDNLLFARQTNGLRCCAFLCPPLLPECWDCEWMPNAFACKRVSLQLRQSMPHYFDALRRASFSSLLSFVSSFFFSFPGEAWLKTSVVRGSEGNRAGLGREERNPGLAVSQQIW